MQIQQESEQSHQDQLNRQFGRQQFIDIVNNLLQQFNLKTGKGAKHVYDQISSTKGKVIGKDILEAVASVKHDIESRRVVDAQIANYRHQISQLKKKGITCISTFEFEELFEKQNPNGIITDQIKNRIKNIDYISLQKLSRILDDIEQMEQGNVLNHKLQIGNLQKSSIFAESQFNQLPDIKIDVILDYAKQNILDSGVKANLTGMLKLIQRKIYDMQQNQIILKQVEDTLRRNQEQLDDELYKTYKIIDKKQLQNERLRTKVKQYEEQVNLMNKRYQHDILNNLQQLETENESYHKNIVNLTVQNEELQAKIEWFKSNYEGISKQYEQFLKEVNENKEKQIKQKQERMFTQRTTKQQLEDALAKISRLRSENSELKQKNSDLVFDYENKVSYLEQRIKEVEESRQAYNISKSFLGDSKIRNSYLDYNSRIRDSDNQTIQGSRMVKKVESNATQDSQEGVRSSVQAFRSYIGGQNSHAFKKKKQLISIRISALDFDDDNESHIHQESDVIPNTNRKEENKEQALQRSRRSMSNNLPKNQKQQIKKVQTQNNLSKNGYKKQRRLLTNLGYIIISDGSRYPVYVILSEDRFTFLDSKMRPGNTIKLSQLKKIVFCHYNSSWMVLKVKPGQVNEKKQTINDTVLSVMNRTDVLQFIHLRCSKKLMQNSIKVQFQRQDNIWITAHQSQTLLSNFVNYYNLNRISIDNAGNMFEASVKQNSLFNFGDDVIIIVSRLGILVFERDGDYLLERMQKLLYIMPIVQLMEVETTAGTENRLVIKYKADKKIMYRIKLNSKSMARKLKVLIQEQRKQTAQAKAAQVQKYSIFTSVLGRASTHVK